MTIIKTRVDESRERLFNAFMFAMGSYTEQEAKKLDQWRDQDYFKIYAHLKHEITEVKRSKDLTKQIHNACDMVGLSCILLAHLLDKNGINKDIFEKEMIK
jgi:hypothetical protein